MSFFISDAMAEGAPAAASTADSWMGLLPLVAMMVLFYFILIRPQSKRAKEHKNMVEALQKGDEVVTQGGILGKITQVSENFVTVEISRDVSIHVQKHAVAALMPKGTIKELN